MWIPRRTSQKAARTLAPLLRSRAPGLGSVRRWL